MAMSARAFRLVVGGDNGTRSPTARRTPQQEAGLVPRTSLSGAPFDRRPELKICTIANGGHPARTDEMNPSTPSNLNDPRNISDKGEAIYHARYRESYEREHPGKFVAINVVTGAATLGDTSSAALLKASDEDSTGIFHLIRVGHPGLYEVGLAYRNVDTNWSAR